MLGCKFIQKSRVSFSKSKTLITQLSAHTVKANCNANMDEPNDTLCSKASLQHSLLKPPAEVRGMKSLDTKLFMKNIVVPVLEININAAAVITKRGVLKKYLLKLLNFKPVQDGPSTSMSVKPKPSCVGTLNSSSTELESDPQTEQKTCCTSKIIYLNPLVVKSYNDFEECDRECLESFGITEQSLQFVEFTLRYENWRAEEVLKAVLPEDREAVSSFSKIGHIIHLNLRDHVLDYKQIVGEILLDKIVGAKTVVNKIDCINSTFRNFEMELICGENNMMASVRENSCIFEFDFSSVYWNPRLSTEHKRITDKFNEGDVLYDVFAGVGPFSIPVCKRKCIVLANDLNPESYKWLQHNGKVNKVLPFLKTFNKDGIDFIKEDVKSDMLDRWTSDNQIDCMLHITMNLPALADTFLFVFNGLFSPEEINPNIIRNVPTVHLYCFTKGLGDPATLARNNVKEKLGPKFDENDILEIFHVRSVSSYKEMMRVSFRLSLGILFNDTNTIKRPSTGEYDALPPKIIHCENASSVIKHGETEGTELPKQQEK